MSSVDSPEAREIFKTTNSESRRGNDGSEKVGGAEKHYSNFVTSPLTDEGRKEASKQNSCR